MRRLDGYEYRPLRLPAHVSRSAAREVLQLHAHVHGWELARVHRSPDGTRSVWLRRRLRPGRADEDLTALEAPR